MTGGSASPLGRPRHHRRALCPLPVVLSPFSITPLNFIGIYAPAVLGLVPLI